MQSIGGRWTNSQQHQFQEPSQPQNSRTNNKVLHVWSCMCESPPKTQPSIIYTKGQALPA